MNKKLPIIFSLFLTSLTTAGYSANLFYLETSTGKCTVNLHKLPENNKKIIFSAPSCPKNIIMSEEFFYYTLDRNLYSIAYKSSSKHAKKIAEFAFDDETEIWIDQKSKKIKIAYLQMIPEGKYKLINDEFVFSVDRKQYKISGFGLPALAFALELNGQRWKVIEIRPTTTAAGETLGLDVLLAYKQADQGEGTSVSQKLKVMTCLGEGPLNCEVSKEERRRLFPREAFEQVGVLRSNEQSVYFNVAFGDSAHAIQPVYICDLPCQSPQKIEVPEFSQIALAVKDRYLLLTEEYTGKHPMIFDLKSKKKILDLKAGQLAVFLQ